MNLKVIIYFWVALLPSWLGGAQSSASNAKTLVEYSADVDKIADEGTSIDGIFKPSKDGLMSNGSIAFTYRGILLPINKQIAMKFTTLEKKRLAEKEYEIYTYLKAINDSNVERYGIPSVYYYGYWDGHDLVMMGISLLDQDLNELAKSRQFFESDINVLIVLRDFILTSKYIHSCGVRHDDVKLANMMIRRHQTFLIDFNLSHKLNVKNLAGSPKFKPRRALIDGHRYPKDDWESFLYSMCDSLGVRFHWYDKKTRKEVLKLKRDTIKTVERIEAIRSKKLRNIFVSFAVHIFDDGDAFESDGEDVSRTNAFIHCDHENKFPDYDFFHKLINDEINKFNLTEPVMFSWLKNAEREEAIEDLITNPIPDITEIEEPIFYDYELFEYPTVDLLFFRRAYKDWIAPVSPNLMTNLSAKSSGRSSKRSKLGRKS